MEADGCLSPVITMHTVPDLFLKKLVAQLDNENAIGVMVSGSFAPGEGGPYSAIDLWQYVREIPLLDDAVVVNRTMKIIAEAGL